MEPGEVPHRPSAGEAAERRRRRRRPLWHVAGAAGGNGYTPLTSCKSLPTYPYRRGLPKGAPAVPRGLRALNLRVRGGGGAPEWFQMRCRCW